MNKAVLRFAKTESAARAIIGTASVVALIVIWQVCAVIGLVDVKTLSSPTLVVSSAIDLLGRQSFWANAYISLIEFVWGMIISCVIGVTLGIAIGRLEVFREISEPVLDIFYCVPTVIFLPLIILWFGVSINAYAFLVFISAVFSIIINTAAGIQEVDPSIIRAARAFGASNFDIFRLVLIPSSLSYTMAGIRLGLGRGLIGVVLGEMYFSIGGIGNMIMKYQAGLNTDALMVIAIIVGVFGVAIIGVSSRVEKALAPWRSTRIE